ncbi:hypothetical protein Anas_06694 [Armadillidium nasatum]|uniref:Caspase family p20 domain-containing protein n=1 Tax=Armadillidium nasatum TaxID=96803 RepID=A0A5N5SYI5_9CRUS|nr:hypothetical protein Anas_06694 [Armadillidium nasatum]
MFTWVVNGKSLKGTQSSRYTIMSSMSPPDYNSSLVYTVGEDNGTTLKVLCVVKSADSSQFSDEVKVKIVSKDSSSIEYFAGSKWALLIANTDYNIDPLPPLFTPASDMEKLAKELSEMSFHCLMLTNLNLIELKNSVKFFSSLIKPGDYGKKNIFVITIKIWSVKDISLKHFISRVKCYQLRYSFVHITI